MLQVRTPRLPILRAAAGGLFLLAAFCGVSFQRAAAQEQAGQPRAAVASKFDEYGRAGHCDLTARLDNFAVTLQSEPDVKGFIIGYDPADGMEGHANKRLRVARLYLTHERGLDSSRLTVVNGGRKEGATEAVTELWVVPEGALPPVFVPETDPAAEFTGRLDFYHTEEATYREMVEMGYSDSALAHREFADRLKAQPGSTGYLVIRTPRAGAPGAWRRIARRDERILRKDFEVEDGRLRSIDGGEAEGEHALVELWVLPNGAPPPSVAAAPAKKTERVMSEAFQLNALGDYGAPEEDEAEWVLENLAELLREDPQARVSLIVQLGEEPEAEEDVAAEPAESAAEEEERSAEAGAGAVEGERDAAEGGEASAGEPEEPAFDAQAVAEQWRRKLVEKYGVDERRVQVATGHPKISWGGAGMLRVWVAPKGAPLPDPLAVTREEEPPAEESEAQSVGETAPAAPPSPSL